MAADYRQYPFPKGRHPRGWAETTVGAVLLEIQSGFSSGKHNQSGMGIPHLRPMSVTPFGEVTLEGVRYIPPDAGGLRLADNDVLFTNTSSTVWVGKTGVVHKPGDWAFSNHMTRLRVGTGMDPEFVARQLHYLCMCGYFAFHCTKHINQSSISGKHLTEKVPFRCPPAKEQTRITRKLTALLKREQTVREALKSLPALIQEYRAAVLEAASTGHLVPTEDELARKEGRDYEPASVLLERILQERRAKWEADQLAKMRVDAKQPKDDKWKGRYKEPFSVTDDQENKLPPGWILAALDQLSWSAGYGTSTKCNHDGKGPPVVRIPNIQQGRFDLADLKFARSKDAVAGEEPLRKGDFVLIRTNGSRSLVGAGALVRKTFERPHYFASYLIRFRLLAEKFEPSWVEAIWNAPQIRAQVLQMAISTAGQYNLSMGNLSQLPVPLPPLAEQKRILGEVKRRLSVADAIEKETIAAFEQASELRASFFHRAISGKLVSQHQADERAEELLSRIEVEGKAKAEESKSQKAERKKPMKKLSTALVRETIRAFPQDRFSFGEIIAAVSADYDPLKDILFELLAEEEPCVKQVFDPKAKEMRFERVSA